jgi:ATP-binding cassette subfamily C (CFTR/MRP) protein 4
VNHSDMKKIQQTNFRINTEQRILNYTIYNDTDSDNYKNSMQNRHQMIYLFPIISVTLTIMSLLKPVLLCQFTRKVSISLHKLLFERIVNASMDFFSSHYVGNILNRFSEDLVCVDERVPNSMYTGLEVRIYIMLFIIIWI